MTKRAYLYLGLSLWVLTVIFVAAPIWPYVFYRLSPGTSEVLASTIGNTVTTVPAITPAPRSPQGEDPEQSRRAALPDFDPSLPKENGLLIDKIGVRGEIHEGENWAEILKTGIWRVPDFGTPEDDTLPIILAAHRFGYVTWTNSFRTLNSFYNLPKLKVGDKVEIIWNQRKYVYEIYKEETGPAITDYTANLILYTCDLWNSPTRIFKYLKRVI
ncbi:MAG: sortase [Microgenomates group bacterium]